MPRPRRSYLQKTHDHVQGWADWLEHHINTSPIGYPSSAVEGRIMEGLTVDCGPAKCKCPEVMMPEWCARVDHAIRDMPPELHTTINRKYLKAEKVSRRKLDEALIWLSARIGIRG